MVAKRTRAGGTATARKSDLRATRETDEDYGVTFDDDDPAGPAGQPSKEIRGRVTKTMYKDILHACADHDVSITDLVNEGLRYIVYGTPPRHVAVRKKNVAFAR